MDAAVDFSSATSTIMVAGNEYKLSPLTMGDRFKAERRIRDVRISHLIEAVRTKPLPDAVLGKALADIECNPIKTEQLLDTYESQSYLLYLALLRGGTSVTEQMVADFPPMMIKTLGQILRFITGLEDTSEEENPTTCSTETSTESAFVGATN